MDDSVGVVIVAYMLCKPRRAEADSLACRHVTMPTLHDSEA